MEKVVVQYDDKVQFYDNVTKVQFFGADDFFSAHLDIFQGSKKTVLDVYRINGFEVVERLFRW